MLEAVVKLVDGRTIKDRGYTMAAIRQQLGQIDTFISYRLTRRPLGQQSPPAVNRLPLLQGGVKEETDGEQLSQTEG